MINLKKVLLWLFMILLSIAVILLGFDNKKNIVPNYLYQVYLDDQILGVIEDKEELYNYIDKEGKNIKEKYNAKKVNAPNGLDVKRIVTYDDKVDDVKEVYNKIKELKPLTITGYQFTVKHEEIDDEGNEKTVNDVIYVTDDKIFKESMENTIISFIGEDNYNKYKDNSQTEIKDIGIYYKNIYIDNIITNKKVNISVNEKIYNNANDLSQYILFSENNNNKTYTVQPGDTIEKISENNKISVQEFLVSNPEFSSVDNILYPGQTVSVAYANPIVDVVADVEKVDDQTSYFTVEERASSDMIIGYDKVIQEGENGINRVTQEIIYKNGFISSAEITNQTVIKPTTNKIVEVGTKYVSGVAGGYWSWPTTSRTISSPFGWRSGGFHEGLDIYNYYGAPIYAANNGVVTNAGWYGTYGIFVGINHNNGFGTGYGHMSALAPGIQVGSIVERGQVIGYIGSTGYSSGPHVHFELYYGSKHPGYNFGMFLDPNILY